MKIAIINYTNSFLRSFGQIMLQEKTTTGFLFFIGIGLNSPVMLLGAIIAILSGLVIAKLFKYNSDSIHNGLYGFNSALVGIAVFFFLGPSVLSLTLLIFGAALSTFIMHFMLIRMPSIYPLTAPFILSTWLIYIIIETVGISTSVVAFSTNATGDLYSVMRGIAQVMFQDYWLSGVIFICGLLVNSFKVATWAVIGSTLGMLTARTFNFSEDLALMGIYGFNASLVAIALSIQYGKMLWPILLGIVLSVFLTWAFELMTLPALTAPFVLTSWLIIELIQINTDDV